MKDVYCCPNRDQANFFLLAIFMLALGWTRAAGPTAFDEGPAFAADTTEQLIVQNRIRDRPLTVAFSVNGRFSRGKSWDLSLNSAGQGEVTVRTLPERKRVAFQLPGERMDQIRQSLLKEAFFELKAEYGRMVIDGHHFVLTVIAGDHVKSVTIRDLDFDGPFADRKHLDEAARAVRIAQSLLGLFQEPDAVDLASYFKQVNDETRRK